MLRSYWVKHRKAVGLTAFVLVAAWFVWLLSADLSAVSASLQDNAANNSSKYARDAEDYVARRCVGLAPLDQENCTREAEGARDTDQREEYDLAAQQVTAWWTQIMGIAALIGMGISIVGVFLVWTTFAEARNANQIAMNTLMAENRAWLKIHAKLDRLYLAYEWAEAEMSITIENVGNSVARNVAVWGALHIVRESYMIKHDFHDSLDPQFAPIDRDRNIWPNSSENFERNAAGTGVGMAGITTPTFRVFARAVVEYHTVFDNPGAPFRISEYFFEVHQPNAPYLTGNFGDASASAVFLPEIVKGSAGGGRLT